jgi:hypothetical protein
VSDTDAKWWMDNTLVVSLGHYLVDNESYDAHQLLELFETPWSFEDEWQRCLRAELAEAATAVQDRIERNLA